MIFPIQNLNPRHFKEQILGETSHVKTKEGGEEKGGVDLEETNKNLVHYLRSAFYSQLNSKVGNILTKATVLRVNLRYLKNLSLSHTHTMLIYLTLKLGPLDYYFFFLRV